MQRNEGREMSKLPKYRALLNSDETPIDMRAVVPAEGRDSGKSAGRKGRRGRSKAAVPASGGVPDGKAGYAVRKHKRVGSGSMPPPANKQNRQVRVKAKTHDRGRGAYKSSVSALVNYIGKEGRTFDRERDITADDREAIKDRWSGDRSIHHWMPSPADGDKMTLADVQTMTRAMMDATERQTGRLEWLAGAEWKEDDSHPSGKWHVHIAVRAVQDDRDLSFHPITERHWLRHHAEEAATDVLGWRGGRGLEEERTRQERVRDLADERLEDRNNRDRERGNRDLSQETRERDLPSRQYGRDGMELER